MTAPTFATPVANAYSTLASPYTAGSGSMTLVSATNFGSLSGSQYLRISVFAPGATSAAVAVCHLKVTAVTGNVLTIAGALDGSTDTSVAAGGTVDVAPAVGTFNDITNAILNLATINGNSLLVGGNIVISGSATVTVPLSATTLTINSGNTTTYNGNTIAATNAAAQSITIASGAALGTLLVEQLGAGIVSFVAGSGVTLNQASGLSTTGAHTFISLVQESTDVYTVIAGAGGVSTYAALSDAATVNLPTTNTPLSTALAAKADASATTTALAGKQATLVSLTNIRTVNGSTLLGTTDLAIGIASVTVPLAATTLTLDSTNTATYNAATIAATNASAQTITINSGAALTAGGVVEQLGAGIVSLVAGGGVTLNAPNGLATSGPRTTLVYIQEATDVYSVFAAETADPTFVNAAAGATPAVDMAKYAVVDLTLTANCTPTFSGSVSGQAFSVTLILRQDATGSRTLTLPTTKWAGGTAFAISTAANAIDIISLTTVNGGASYFGFIGGKAFA